jgi:tRNA threonylcarbamoyl adenosine modification protein YeaZ
MILAIETATELCGVALVDRHTCIASRTVVEKNIHSERLMVLVDEVLREAGIAVGALSGIAVSIGPGSFTGLRIGLSAAKGLAYARSLPLLAVPTLDALAYEARRLGSSSAIVGRASARPADAMHGDDPRASARPADALHGDDQRASARPDQPEIICAVIDAKRNEAYYAFFEPGDGAADDIRCVSAHAIATVSEITAQFPAGRSVFVAGDAAQKLSAVQPDTFDTVRYSPVSCNPVSVGLLAEHRFALLAVDDYSELEPVYIRDFVTTQPRIANQTAIP